MLTLPPNPNPNPSPSPGPNPDPNQAPKRLYKSGYAFVWDASGKGVVHKNYEAEHSASGSAPDGQA